MYRVGPGFDSLDAAPGGLIARDNVAPICDDPVPYRSLAVGLNEQRSAPGRSAALISFQAKRSLAVPGATTIDARRGFECPLPIPRRRDRALRQVTHDDLARTRRPGNRVPAGADAAASFFEHVCQAMLDAGSRRTGKSDRRSVRPSPSTPCRSPGASWTSDTIVSASSSSGCHTARPPSTATRNTAPSRNGRRSHLASASSTASPAVEASAKNSSNS